MCAQLRVERADNSRMRMAKIMKLLWIFIEVEQLRTVAGIVRGRPKAMYFHFPERSMKEPVLPMLLLLANNAPIEGITALKKRRALSLSLEKRNEAKAMSPGGCCLAGSGNW